MTLQSATLLERPPRVKLEERALPGLHASLIRAIQSIDERWTEAPVLDLGCGTGAFLARLHAEGLHHLAGVDRDPNQFQAYDIARFVCEDLDTCEAEALGTASFNLVTIVETIEHVENPGRLVALASKLLTPRGWMLITSPNIYSLRARLRFLLTGSLPGFETASSKALIQLDHLHPVILEAYERKVFRPLNLSVQRSWSYPENTGQSVRWFVAVGLRLLRLCLPDKAPGDILCLLLRKD
jgi:SAM-dependent methyltransferase